MEDDGHHKILVQDMKVKNQSSDKQIDNRYKN